MKMPTIFTVVLFGPLPPHLTPHFGLQLLIPLTLSTLCVAGRACLSQLTGEGEKDPNKTTEKTCGPLPIYIPFVCLAKFSALLHL
jgi:hypothetical protein